MTQLQSQNDRLFTGLNFLFRDGTLAGSIIKFMVSILDLSNEMFLPRNFSFITEIFFEFLLNGFCIYVRWSWNPL